MRTVVYTPKKCVGTGQEVERSVVHLQVTKVS